MTNPILLLKILMFSYLWFSWFVMTAISSYPVIYKLTRKLRYILARIIAGIFAGVLINSKVGEYT